MDNQNTKDYKEEFRGHFYVLILVLMDNQNTCSKEEDIFEYTS